MAYSQNSSDEDKYRISFVKFIRCNGYGQSTRLIEIYSNNIIIMLFKIMIISVQLLYHLVVGLLGNNLDTR